MTGNREVELVGMTKGTEGGGGDRRGRGRQRFKMRTYVCQLPVTHVFSMYPKYML